MIAEQWRQSMPKAVRKRARQRAIDKQTLAVLDALPADVAVLDAAGVILAVNAAWRRSAAVNGYAGSGYGVGSRYLEVYRQMADAGGVCAAEQAICAVLGQEQAEHCFEYRSPGTDTKRRFLFRAVRLKDAGPLCVMVSHEEITSLKQAEARARRPEAAREPDQTSAQKTLDETRRHLQALMAQAQETVSLVRKNIAYYQEIQAGGYRLAAEYRATRQQAELALGETKSRLQAIFDHAQEAFLLVDDQGRYIDANPAACALTGYSHAELLGMNVFDITPPEGRPNVPDAWQLFIQAGTRRGEFTILRKDGNTVAVEFHAVSRIVPGVHLSVLRDISARQQAQAALRDHSARLSLLHEIDQTILAAGSLEETAQAVLQVIYRLIPYWRASVLVYDFDLEEYQVAAVCNNGVSSEPPTRRSQIADLADSDVLVAVLRRGENYAYDLRQLAATWPEAAALLANGMRYQIFIPLIAQGELFGSVQIAAPAQETFDSMWMPIIREILDSLAIGVRQARLFEQVQDGRERQHELARRLVAAQEQERRQIARELHDRIGQNLAVLNMNLTNTRRQLSCESAKRVDGRLADAIELVDETIEQIRNVMADLRPAILDDFGLVAALRWYIWYFARHTDLVVLLEIEEQPGAPRLPPDLETALFRIVQEALTNVLKHARATQATLALTTIGSTIRLVVADDGVGFKFGALPRPTQRWSLGLMTMQERAEAVGGRLVIDSAPGQGTRIITEVTREEHGDRSLSGR